MKESDKCRYIERQQAFRSCNAHECEKEAATTERPTTTATTQKHVEPRVQFVQNDGMPSKCCLSESPLIAQERID